MGRRLPSDLPKQFLPLGERPIIVHTVAAFARVPAIERLVVVVPWGWEGRCAEMFAAHGLGERIDGIVPGGATRQLSCLQGLRFLEPDPPDVVIVHDGVRPLVSEELIARAAAEGKDGMTFAIPTIETIVTGFRGEVTEVLPRDCLYQVQTPQAFPFSILWEAHHEALKAGISDASDDAGLVLRMGHRVKIVPGDPRNIKVTRPEDLELAQILIRRS